VRTDLLGHLKLVDLGPSDIVVPVLVISAGCRLQGLGMLAASYVRD
jgi:hypothetical protein